MSLLGKAWDSFHNHGKAFDWAYHHEKQLREAQALLEQTKRASGFGLPDGIDKLRKYGIEVPEEFHHDAQFLAIARYSKEQRKKDAQRMVRLDEVLAVLIEFEDSMIEKTVKDPWECFTGPIITLWATARNVKNIAKAIWFVLWDGTPAMYALTISILTTLNVIFNVKRVTKMFRAHYALRDFWCDYLRTRALPQSSATRHRRRKRTRL